MRIQGLGKLGLATLLMAFMASCAAQKNEKLPILGMRDVQGTDTLYHTIPDFSFVDQDSQVVNQETVAEKIYVVDFFFTSCPSICPKMSQQMLRLHDEFKDEDRVVLISHSIDPAYDDVKVLNEYATALGVDSKKWHLVTGEKDSIYHMATQYMISAAEDENAPGGFIHSGAFMLVDTNRHIRAYFDGTKPEQVDELMDAIRSLLNEQFQN
ncbi:SCO family protein [Pontibacter sp. G13]|uniref:SCO family protein n=1 Tax=Pontibacter sp. G13 TaxID=3074898 RepID=UPI00288AD669|nr:SCO family protein [Pontibacter sp. G13]WNJ18240.1 SCO family protein [Pontibacter sp. G13]